MIVASIHGVMASRRRIQIDPNTSPGMKLNFNSIKDFEIQLDTKNLIEIKVENMLNSLTLKTKKNLLHRTLPSEALRSTINRHYEPKSLYSKVSHHLDKMIVY